MEYQDWKAALDPKVQGSWNLHQVLPRGLDFFILVSSMMSTIGGVSLSAYSAANSYMDALARHRIMKGKRAAALGLGVVPDGGYLTEHPERLAGVEGVERYVFIYMKDIYGLLEVYCDPECPFALSLPGCQPILGVRPPSHWCHLEEVPTIFSQPMWGHMHKIPYLDSQNPGDEGNMINNYRKRAIDTAERLTAASSLAEAGAIARDALAQRIITLLGISEDRLDTQRSLLSYGVDSLSAVDIRNWVGQVFDIDLPIFEILSGTDFSGLGLSIARKFISKNQR